ncbi:hypothetical protein [Proteiniphilum sp. X52]|uniref:hypothetical protein n=1 Tax=Proteiniphilum sp. X52 TaxID=2382159 RepID=UPI000F09B1E4|nr:hypothetical protein [Proteiniphilum sp. X52]RNC63895.1 hypothetical protein D7D25_14400 [Proteiniphilum sp. X52]
MKKIKFIISFLLIMLTFHFVKAQSHLTLIEEKYNQLDSVSYIDNIKDPIVRYSMHAFGQLSDDTIERRYKVIKEGIKNQNMRFVLNVGIDTTKLDTDNYLLVEDFEYDFNIYCHDKKFNPTFYVFFSEDRLDIVGRFYPSYSRKYTKKATIAIKRVLEKKPKYILSCTLLTNTVLYVKGEKIFVYRILQGEEYELKDYVTKFKNTMGL